MLNPPYLLGPGQVRASLGVQPAAGTSGGSEQLQADCSQESQGVERDIEEEPPSQQQPQPASQAKKRRQSNGQALLASVLANLEAAERNRQKRHEERLAALKEAETNRNKCLQERNSILLRLATALEERCVPGSSED